MNKLISTKNHVFILLVGLSETVKSQPNYNGLKFSLNYPFFCHLSTWSNMSRDSGKKLLF